VPFGKQTSNDASIQVFSPGWICNVFQYHHRRISADTMYVSKRIHEGDWIWGLRELTAFTGSRVDQAMVEQFKKRIQLLERWKEWGYDGRR